MTRKTKKARHEERRLVTNRYGQTHWVTPEQAEFLQKPWRKPMPVAQVSDLVPCDPQVSPWVHILDTAYPSHGALEIALTGGWTFHQGMQLLWSMLYDDLSDLPPDVEQVTVHAGIPTPGCYTTFPGFTVNQKHGLGGVDIPYALNTEGGEDAIRRCRPCASIGRERFIECGWGAFYSELRR